jgi:hypothetical protein
MLLIAHAQASELSVKSYYSSITSNLSLPTGQAFSMLEDFGIQRNKVFAGITGQYFQGNIGLEYSHIFNIGDKGSMLIKDDIVIGDVKFKKDGNGGSGGTTSKEKKIFLSTEYSLDRVNLNYYYFNRGVIMKSFLSMEWNNWKGDFSSDELTASIGANKFLIGPGIAFFTDSSRNPILLGTVSYLMGGGSKSLNVDVSYRALVGFYNVSSFVGVGYNYRDSLFKINESSITQRMSSPYIEIGMWF